MSMITNSKETFKINLIIDYSDTMDRQSNYSILPGEFDAGSSDTQNDGTLQSLFQMPHKQEIVHHK